MTKYILFLLLIQGSICSAQNKKCFCDENKLMNESAVNCDTIKLKNNYNLYWQFNCDRIWLTLEKSNQSKFVINEIEKSKMIFFTEVYGLTNNQMLDRANWAYAEGKGYAPEYYAYAMNNFQKVAKS